MPDPLLQLLAQRVAGLGTSNQSHVNIDGLALERMRHANGRGFGHLRMRHQGALDFGGAHAVSGDVEHIVDAPGDPVVTVLVAAGAVAGEVHAAEGLEVGIDETVVVTVNGAHLPWPGVENHQIALRRAFQQVAEIVHQPRHYAEQRPRRRAGLERRGTG